MVTDDGTISIMAEDLASNFARAITAGSGRDSLRPSDFKFRINHGETTEGKESVSELMSAGMRPIDAVYYLQCKQLKLDPKVKQRHPGSPLSVSEADTSIGMFIWFFSLLTQGKHKLENEPKFLRQSMKLGANWHLYQDELTSCDFSKLPVEWIKQVHLGCLSARAKNRLALGAAGHRLLSSLRYVRRADLHEGCEEGENFVYMMLEWTQGMTWWDLHPLFKTPAVMTATASLNKLISEFLGEAVKPGRIDALMLNKVLTIRPARGAIPGRWAALKPSDLPALTTPIGGFRGFYMAPEPRPLQSGFKIAEPESEHYGWVSEEESDSDPGSEDESSADPNARGGSEEGGSNTHSGDAQALQVTQLDEID